jgi:hypothetical protein
MVVVIFRSLTSCSRDSWRHSAAKRVDRLGRLDDQPIAPVRIESFEQLDGEQIGKLFRKNASGCGNCKHFIERANVAARVVDDSVVAVLSVHHDPFRVGVVARHAHIVGIVIWACKPQQKDFSGTAFFPQETLLLAAGVGVRFFLRLWPVGGGAFREVPFALRPGSQSGAGFLSRSLGD